MYSANGEAQIDVKFENEIVWLNLNQITELFDRDKSVISRHLKNIYKEGEFDISSTVTKNATVQIKGDRQIKREIDPFETINQINSVNHGVRRNK